MAELKIDGLSVSLVYVDGELQVGATRGDGSLVKISLRMLNVSDIPHKLEQPLTITVRGEAYLPRKSFDKINEERQWSVRICQSSNAAAGTLRQLIQLLLQNEIWQLSYQKSRQLTNNTK